MTISQRFNTITDGIYIIPYVLISIPVIYGIPAVGILEVLLAEERILKLSDDDREGPTVILRLTQTWGDYFIIL